MIEIIKSIYKRKSYKRLRSVVEVLYAQYERSEDNHISTSELARSTGKDASNIGKSLARMRKEGIVDVKHPETKKTKKGGRIRRLYKLSSKAYEVIKKTKTAN